MEKQKENNNNKGNSKEPSSNGVRKQQEEDEPLPKKKKKQTNWSFSENKARLEQAQKDWLGSRRTALDDNGEKYSSLRMYAIVVGIPLGNFEKVCHKDPEK